MTKRTYQKQKFQNEKSVKKNSDSDLCFKRRDQKALH